jgi:hypothetical protein
MRQPQDESKQSCAGCGLEIDGGTAGCQALFDTLIARDFSDIMYFGVHRMAVDTYALQHPDRYCASAKSLAAHLVGLHWALERGGDSAVGSEALRRWLDGPRDLKKPDLPRFRGQVTIADALATASAMEYRAAVRRWAEATWGAYSSLHDQARAWAHEAAAASAKPRRG